jgi:hypothetical protein
MSSSLPGRPSLDHLRHQARDLQGAYDEGESSARDRVRASHGANAQPKLKLSQAQCVIAREHGFRSWRKLREAVVDQSVTAMEEDPLHVQYASYLLLIAADMGMLEFELCRREDEVLVESWGESWSLPGFIQFGGHAGSLCTEWSTELADLVWERLLVMAELTDPEAMEGRIQLRLGTRYPSTHWNIAVSRLGPDRLGFELELDRVEIMPSSSKTGERQTPGQRMAAKIREGAAGPLSAEAESALQEVTARYDAAMFHRGAIREVAALLPACGNNLDAVVRCAQLVGMFGYHTKALMDIARIAADCDQPCPEFPHLAELAVRRLSGTGDAVRLAREAATAQSVAERAQVHGGIAEFEAGAEYPTIDEALSQQEAV